MDDRGQSASQDGEKAVGAGLDPVAMFRAKEAAKRGLFGPPDDADDASDASQTPLAGRYALHRMIGQGGFGTVFEAQDPKLDRKVAVKLIPLTPDESEASSTAFEEARTLAQLRHPSIVQVYDVGVFDASGLLGRDASRCLYIVMELLSGLTLRKWLRAAPRSVREIIEVLTQAGEGVAAAHDRGIVHRDLKPSNIHVDGSRAMVLDFDLAKITEAGSDASHSGGIMLTRLTGTPSYMAPEQHEGGTLGPTIDQFALAVCLYEALYGRLPFEGEGHEAIAAAKRQGPPTIAPLRGLSSRQRRALHRALQPEPGDRFESMAGFMDAMGGGRRQRRVAIAGGAAVVALAAGLSLGLASRPDPCARFQSQVDALWNDEVRATMSASFTAHGLPEGPEALESVQETLDARLERWSEVRAAVCREEEEDDAVTSDGEVSARVYCLERHRDRVAEVIDVLDDATPAIVQNVPRILEALEPLQRCDSEDDLPPRPGWLIEDPAAGFEVDVLIVRAKEHLMAGAWDEAVAVAEQALERSVAVGAPVYEAEALLVICQSMWTPKGREYSAESCEKAMAAGERALRDDLAYAALFQRARYIKKIEPDRLAVETKRLEAKRRLLGEDPIWDAQLLYAYGKLDMSQQKLPDAIDKYERVREVFEQEFGLDHIDVIRVTNDLGVAFRWSGDMERARTEESRLLDDVLRIYGVEHQWAAIAYNNMGQTCLRVEDYECAEEVLLRALTIKQHSEGPNSPALLSTLGNLAEMYEGLGRDYEALIYVRHAMAIASRLRGEESRSANLASMMHDLGRIPGDPEPCEAMTAIAEQEAKREGRRSIELIMDRAGRCWREVDRPDRAIAIYEQLVAHHTWERMIYSDKGIALLNLAELSYSIQRDDDAARWLERLWIEPRISTEHRRRGYAMSAWLNGTTEDERDALLERRIAEDPVQEEVGPEERKRLLENAKERMTRTD